MSNAIDMSGQQKKDNIKLRSYVSGFISSIVLTLVAYGLVVNHVMSKWGIGLVLAVLAMVQFLVQLLFFMHLGTDTRPRWKLVVLIFMVLIVVILVFGSMWIMYSLNYNMILQMTPQQILQYMNSQQGL